MTVSLCVIAYNEEELIGGLLEDISMQTYPHKLTEIIFVDNGSTDTTSAQLSTFERMNRDFMRVCIRTQSKSNQAHGWNTALCNAMGDIIIRIDAHARIPEDYVEQCVAEIENGEDIVGGGRPCITRHKNDWNNTLLAAEECLFGSSIMGYRRKQNEKRYLSSLFHAAYKREVFEKVGGFNEFLGRTEDNELHYRMRKRGYKFACCPSISSNQYMRESFKAMLRQKFSNGYWIGLTTFVSPGCLSLLHFAPFFLLLALIITIVSAISGHAQLLELLLAVYLLFDGIITISALNYEGFNKTKPLLFLMFPALHLTYGAGTLCGFVYGIPWKAAHPSAAAKKEIRRVKRAVKNNTIKDDDFDEYSELELDSFDL